MSAGIPFNQDESKSAVEGNVGNRARESILSTAEHPKPLVKEQNQEDSKLTLPIEDVNTLTQCPHNISQAAQGSRAV